MTTFEHGEFDNFLDNTVLSSKLDDAVFQHLCDRVKSHSVPCIESFVDSIGICMSDKEKKQASVVMEALRGAFNFICSRNSGDFEVLKLSKTDECLIAKNLSSKPCFVDHLKDYKKMDENNAYEILSMLTSEEKCDHLVNFESCFRKTFEECEEQRPLELLTGFIKSFLGASPCSDMKSFESNYLVEKTEED